jgi:methyl-accepting chemotaxis protein
VAAIKDISAIITRISGISATISTAIEGQRASTEEIASHIQHAAHESGAVAVSIGDVSRGANETEIASGRVLGAARSLSGDSNRLKLEVDKFLTSVRAA